MQPQCHVTYNADDFGLHQTIDEAVIELAQSGIIRSASVLISSPRLDLGRLKKLQALNISLGVHLALTECRPMSKGRLAPPWVSAEGSFLPHWRSLAPVLLKNRLPTSVVYEEWKSQISRFREVVGEPEFIDSHQNLHLLPQFSAVTKQLLAEKLAPRVRTFYDSLKLDRPLFSAIRLGGMVYPQASRLATYGLFESCKLSFKGLTQILSQARLRHARFVVAVHPGMGIPSTTFDKPAYELNWKEEYLLLKSNELKEYHLKHSFVLDRLR